ncbi:MAG: ligase-associated DNA damage response endonuclease PdeM [Saprospiraceae bacterium]|nr:ligase-associated DNA damage response endonuclease PdeM [Saprospiraceae bacterium]
MSTDTLSNLNITIAKEDMRLLAEKAIFLPAYDMLLIADLHFGKVEHFRKNGIGIPSGASNRDISRLEVLIKKVDAKNVVFLGDLFHSKLNNAWEKFQEMVASLNAYEFHLVIGNHDILEKSKYTGLIVSHQIEIGNLLLTHEPLGVIVEDKYNVCGHIHPAVRMRGRGRQNLKLACFYFGKHTGILPAFGSFTGTHVLKPLADDRVFIVNEGIVLDVSNQAS